MSGLCFGHFRLRPVSSSHAADRTDSAMMPAYVMASFRAESGLVIGMVLLCKVTYLILI